MRRPKNLAVVTNSPNKGGASPPSTKDKNRNSAQGIRSTSAINEKRIKRSLKRNLARKLHRKQNRSTEAPAQESGPGDLPTFKLCEDIWLASLNIRGTRSAVKRRDITRLLTRNRIDTMTIQETHNGENTRVKGKKHSIYFSGGTQEGAIHHGVGIFLKH